MGNLEKANEEAITILKREFSECKDTISVYAQKRKKAFDMAIQALEQTDILDKIRAEIEEYKSRQLALAIGVADLEKGKQIALEYALAVFDKYKAESEGEE
jgi:hypothetical protein